MIRKGWMALAIAFSLALAGTGEAANIVLPRPGQVGFSGQGHLGTLTKSGEYGDLYGTGSGISIRVRYRMRYERGLGLSFERQGFSARDESDTLFAPRTLTLQTATVDVYQLFGTRTNTVKMVSASLGLSQGTQKLNGGDTKVGGIGAGDALVLGVGAGLERFVWQSWAIDLSARYFAHLHHSKVNHGVHVYGGMIFYAGY